jgi:hypothetical protein
LTCRQADGGEEKALFAEPDSGLRVLWRPDGDGLCAVEELPGPGTAAGHAAHAVLGLAIHRCAAAVFAEVAIPIAYSFAARSIAENHQMSKQDIRDSAQYDFQPGLNVVAVCIVFFITFVLMTFALIFALISAGVIEP